MCKTWWMAVLLAASSTASAEPRALTLAEAVELGLRADPLMAESRIAKDRSKLAVLRSQLDRMSLKIDGALAELYNKGNLGGSAPFAFTCTTPFGVLPLDPDTCAGIANARSSATPLPISPDQGIGTFTLAANLNVPLFAGFRVDATVKRNQRLDDAALVGIRQQRKDTALSVMRAYWTVRRLALLYEVQAAASERLREAEAVTLGRVKAGLAPPIDHNRAVLRRLQLADSLADLHGQLREADAQLAVALGLEGEIVLTDTPDVAETPPPPVEVLLDEAHHGRPEIASARLQALAQVQAVRVARSNYYPQLSAQGLFQLGNNPYNPVTASRVLTTNANPFANVTGTLTLGLNLSMNFFDTLNTYTGERDARYEESRLMEERRRAERIVDADVRSAYAHLIRLYDRWVPLREAREVAKDNLRILEGSYKNGDALVIDYLDGQNALTDAERALTDVIAQLKQAALELDASLGQVVGVTR